eukprot:m.205987 g.205987  ORF g.205987 m.205987 type:complete len:321 (+) comp10119_c0_seq51:1356-2318(+)
MKACTACNAMFKWASFEHIAPEFSEWLVATVTCKENYDTVSHYFSSVLGEVDAINAAGKISMKRPGAKEGEGEVEVPIKIIVSPDGKMTNILLGHTTNGSNNFCAKCDMTADQLKRTPCLVTKETTTEQEHAARAEGATAAERRGSLRESLIKTRQMVAFCVLHTCLRICETVCNHAMTEMNRATPKQREEHAAHIRGDRDNIHEPGCGVGGFHFFGPKKEDGDKKNVLEWTNLQWPQLKRIIHSVDLSRVYKGEELDKARQLFALAVIVLYALECEPGAPGYMATGQLQLLSLLVVYLHTDLHGTASTVRATRITCRHT